MAASVCRFGGAVGQALAKARSVSKLCVQVCENALGALNKPFEPKSGFLVSEEDVCHSHDFRWSSAAMQPILAN